MRGVVGGHEVERAASQGLGHAVPVRVRSQGRVYAVEAFEGRDQVVRERQVVRGGVGGYGGPVLEESGEGRRERRGDGGYVGGSARLGPPDKGRRRGDGPGARGGAGDSGQGGGDGPVGRRE